MKRIDEGVISAFGGFVDDDRQSIAVLISCNEGACDSLALELMTEDAEVKQVISELDMLLVKITSKHLKLLESSEHVYAVELDQDASTQSD
jgi:hypothetical protein